jgi:DNA-binding NarL/FixJ family response regulator
VIAQTNALLAVQELVNENDRLRQQIAAGSTAMGDPLPPASTASPSSASSARSNKKKLTKRDVGLMKDLKRLGSTNLELATAFDVNPATVSRIVRGIYHR